MPPADDMEAEAERMLARSNHALEKANRRHEALEDAQQQRAMVEGIATSEDGLVRAAVDNTGMLVRLDLSPSVQDAPPRSLSRAITAVVQRAVADAREKIEQIYVGLLNEGVIEELPPLLAAPPTRDVHVPLHPSPSANGRRPEGRTEPPSGGRRAPQASASDDAPEADAEPNDSPRRTWFDQRPWYP